MRTEFKIYCRFEFEDYVVLVGNGYEQWESLTSVGVIVVVEVYDHTYGNPKKYAGRRLAGFDYYWMDKDGNIDGGSAKQIPPGVSVKRGALIDKDDFVRIYNEACVDEEVK